MLKDFPSGSIEDMKTTQRNKSEKAKTVTLTLGSIQVVIENK